MAITHYPVLMHYQDVIPHRPRNNTRFTTVHRKLYAVNNEHKPKAPQRQKQRSKGYDFDR